MYRSGKQGEKPDVLTHRSQNLLKGIDDSRQQHQFQTLLQSHQLNKDVKKALVVAFCINTANESSEAINDAVDEGVDETVKGK